MIKHAILRTDDGQAYDLLRPGCKNKAGVGGIVEVLPTDLKAGKVRVGVNGVELTGNPPRFPDDLTASPAVVVVDQLDADGKVIDTKSADVEIVGLPETADPPADPPPASTPPEAKEVTAV